jgi:hypothetical protein
MKNSSTGIFIFIDDGESGTSHRAGYPLLIAQGMNKGGFAGAHFAIKSNDLTPIDKFPKPVSGLPDIFQCTLQLHKIAKIMRRGGTTDLS